MFDKLFLKYGNKVSMFPTFKHYVLQCMTYGGVVKMKLWIKQGCKYGLDCVSTLISVIKV